MDCFAVRSRWNCTSDWKAAAECWDSGLLCSHRIASRVAQLFKRARAHCVAAPVFPVALRAQPARLLRHNSVLSLLPDYKIATCGQQMLYQDLGLRSRVSTFVRMRIHFWWTGTILSPTAWKWLRKKYLKHFLNNYLQSQKCSPIKKKRNQVGYKFFEPFFRKKISSVRFSGDVSTLFVSLVHAMHAPKFALFFNVCSTVFSLMPAHIIALCY